MTIEVEDEDDLLDKFGLELKELLREELIKQDKIFTGEAYRSIDYFPRDKVVGSKLDFIYNLEYGRKAGTFVPEKELEKWVAGKLNISNPTEVKRIAWLINRKIYEEGIPMTRFVKIILEKLER